MKKDRRIHYRHVHAMRDLANCSNFAGIKIKKGVFYRSAFLGKLSAVQAKEFVQYFNIGYVIDLRTNAEKEDQPDLYSDLVQYYHIPILDEFDNPLITKENRNRILLDISKNKGGAVKYLERIYRKMVSDEQCLAQFKKIFDIILNKKDDKATSAEITNRQVELKSNLRRYFKSKTAAELKNVNNEEKFFIEIKNLINDKVLSNSKIRAVEFDEISVVEPN